jgi:hypothetical protein
MIPGFHRLGEGVYLKAGVDDFAYQLDLDFDSNSKSSSTRSIPLFTAQPDDAPDVVVITSWTGAQAKHIAKYTAVYAELFPHTAILLITTSIADLTLRTTKRKITALAPAVSYLCSNANALAAIGRHSSILLHAFSDGGSHKAVCLAHAYAAYTGVPLPLAATILDSTPGVPRYADSVTAFARSVPAPYALGRPLGAALLGATWVVTRALIGRQNNVIERTRRALNDPALWGGKGIRGARTYVFSEADDVVRWRDVEAHAQESAEELGVQSLVVRFRNTAHCNHARGNEKYYWAVVLRTWEAKGREVESTNMTTW